MMKILSFVLILFLTSCVKDKIPISPTNVEHEWDKYEGIYKVYDTLGVYLFEAEIKNFEYFITPEVLIDSVLISNFLNSMDIKFHFNFSTSGNYLNFGFHDSIKDYNNKTWSITIIPDDINTVESENCLVNNRMTLYFRKTNIKYWMNESVPYVWENVKHVYVKQPK